MKIQWQVNSTILRFATPRPQVILDRVPAHARRIGRVHNGHPPALTGQFEKCDGKLRQVAKEDTLALDFAFQALLLALEASQEEFNPRVPILLIGADRALRATMRRFESNLSTSRSVSFAPSMRVDEPMLSIVATCRNLESRFGAIRPNARQAPLNSSISAISDKIWGVIRKFERASTGIHYPIHFHPMSHTGAFSMRHWPRLVARGPLLLSPGRS